MKTKYSVLHIFNSICAKNAKQIELNYLIELTLKFAYTYLKYRYKNLNKVLRAEDATLQELSIEAVAPFFERDEAGTFIKIQSSFLSWQPPIKTEESALFFLNQIVAKSTEKYVAVMLRQSDPFFAKMLDSVNYFIDKNGFKKLNRLGTVYIVPADTDEVKGKIIPENEFHQIPIKVFADKKNLLKNIFDYIQQETDYTPAVPLNLLVLKLKECNSSLYVISESTSEHTEQTDVDSVVNEAINKTLQKLEAGYLKKQKICGNEFEVFRKTLIDISVDMKDGGINPGLHKYFIANYKNLDETIYQQKYQNILEYLVKVLKQNIAIELRH